MFEPDQSHEPEKSALMKLLRNKAVEQETLSSPLRMAGRQPEPEASRFGAGY